MLGIDVSARDVVAVVGSTVEAGWVRRPEPFWKVCCKSYVQIVGACSCAISGPRTPSPLILIVTLLGTVLNKYIAVFMF